MNDKTLCEALDALDSDQRRAIAIAAAEARDARVERDEPGDQRMAAYHHAVALMAAEAETVHRGQMAELDRQLRWAGERVELVPDDDPGDAVTGDC